MGDPKERQLRKSGAAVDQVIDTVVAWIAAGRLGPGEQLRQEDLAGELGVSRVPVREALRALAEQRVLVLEKHRGFFVAKRTPAELAQFVRLLELIEHEVNSSIEWPSPEILNRLRQLNQRMLAVADDYDPAETFELNQEFHFTIFALSSKDVMVDELRRLWRLAQPYILAGMLAPEARRRRVEEHEAIVKALSERDRQAVHVASGMHRSRGGRVDTPSAEEAPAPVPASVEPVRFLSAGA
jgi:DNA-binding GntR family transcriptional regulator